MWRSNIIALAIGRRGFFSDSNLWTHRNVVPTTIHSDLMNVDMLKVNKNMRLSVITQFYFHGG